MTVGPLFEGELREPWCASEEGVNGQNGADMTWAGNKRDRTLETGS
jgi:hypothetical protein